MALDPDALRLAEELLQYATQHRFGQLVVEVTVRYTVEMREGKLVAGAVKEVLPRVTVEQLRKAESVIA